MEFLQFLFAFLALFLSSCFLIILLFSSSSSRKRLNLPPGPPCLPVVGNLFQVAGSGKQFFLYLRDIIPIYGPIVTLKMGTKTMIIISNAELAHEALIEKGQVFASRPRENNTRTIFSCNKFTVNASLYGPVWRSLRRNMVQNMLSAARLKEFRRVREVAMDRLVDKIRAEAASNDDGLVWVLKNSRFAVFCILLSMCFGVEMDAETIERVEQIHKAILLILDPKLDDFLPILRPLMLFSKERRRVQEVRKEQIETLVPLIEKRRNAIQNPGSDPTAASFAYIDTLFDLKIEGRKSSPSDAEIVTLCSELLNGGTDTTATAIEWAIGRLIAHPEMQARLYDEITATVGDRTVDEKDVVENMPYLAAFVKELLRRHPPTFFALTHAVTEPAKLGGYDIPTDASLDFFLPGISDDPKIWSEPEKFDPDRFFLGREDADITGIKGVRMIPFGIGRRICPGLGMATIHVNLMVARLVQEFEWVGYPEGTPVDFTEKMEFTIVMKNTLRAKVKPRRSRA